MINKQSNPDIKKWDVITYLKDNVDFKQPKEYEKSQLKRLKNGSKKRYTTRQVFISINNSDKSSHYEKLVIMNTDVLANLLLKANNLNRLDMLSLVEEVFEEN